MLASALEQEHRDIDAGIEAYTAAREKGGDDVPALQRAIGALRRHIYLEEEFIFPTLKAGGLMAPVWVMLREHGEMWAVLDRIDAGLNDGATADSIGTDCTSLLELTEAHNEKEEPVIYPHVDSALDDDAQSRLWTFLDSGSTPDGWVCERAGA